jgi:Signal transduction histidine kinase
MLDDLGLRPALEWQSREFERLYEIPVAVTASESIDFLPEDHRITIYRIIQEALTNCARHARAKQIEVEVLDKQGVIQITIADDGVGFTRSSQTGSGLGLIGIQERVHRLGGIFEVKPRAGGGTVLLAEIPSEDMVIGHA